MRPVHLELLMSAAMDDRRGIREEFMGMTGRDKGAASRHVRRVRAVSQALPVDALAVHYVWKLRLKGKLPKRSLKALCLNLCKAGLM